MAWPKNTKMARYHTGPILAADGKTRYPDVRVYVFETGRANKRVRIDVILPGGCRDTLGALAVDRR